MQKIKFSFLLVIVAAASACSHHRSSETKADPSTDSGTSAPLAEETLELPKNTGMTMNEYLNNIVLPKITDSKIVNRCFLDTRHATTKERAPGHLTFQFEIKLLKQDEQVLVTQVILSSSENLPEWTKPCIIRNYKKLIFPRFPDPIVKTTSAFGSMNMTWKP